MRPVRTVNSVQRELERGSFSAWSSASQALENIDARLSASNARSHFSSGLART